MKWKNTAIGAALGLGAALLVVGCSQVEPKHGTRVTFLLPTSSVPRHRIAAASRYLLRRAESVLRVERPRVDSVSDGVLVLLLPGEKISPKQIDGLLAPTSVEFYHLINVATQEHPDRPWTIKIPASRGGAYLFLGPDAARIDSTQDPRDVLKEVAGAPTEKPVLTGKNILPTAVCQRAKSGWAVLVQFDEAGASRFHEFTKNNQGEYLAVFYNGSLISAPRIQHPISGDQAFITGFATLAQARSAAEQLNTGVLPLKLRIRSVEYY